MTSIKVREMYFSREINVGFKRVNKPIFENLNLDFQAGESVGLVGRNGAGKTTLLRLLAGIFKPDSGTVITSGNVNSILDSGFGLDQALTGRDNVISWLVLRDIKRERIMACIEEVKNFSELAASYDHPVKTYSAGMLMRLILSVELVLNVSGALLIDEGFGAADSYFQAKAQIEIDRLFTQASLLVLASHNDDLLRKFCKRGILLGDCGVIFDGPICDVIELYRSNL
jgi:ABC-type polysaccharide/polyol phosphate transport system ATPase subunit